MGSDATSISSFKMNGESFASSVCAEENGWHVGRAKVVGICGCTNAGKTTVAKELVKLVSWPLYSQKRER